MRPAELLRLLWGANMTKKLEITSMITSGTVKFDAYLTDISQTFASTWNSTEVFGRNDPIATFSNTKRSISIAFEVPAANMEHAKINLKNVGTLSQFMYPGYNTQFHDVVKTTANPVDPAQQESTVAPAKTGQFVSRPPLVKIKFANLVKSYVGAAGTEGGLLGFIDSLSVNPVIEAGMFSDGGNLYPRTISISFGFNVLHQTDVGWEVDSTGAISWMPGSTKIPFM